jgi:hypothetical protein
MERGLRALQREALRCSMRSSSERVDFLAQR